MSSYSMRYSAPYFESNDDISFNMEIPGSRSNTPVRYDTRHPAPKSYRASSTPSSSSLDEHRPPRRFREPTPEEDAYHRRKLLSKPKVSSYTEALLASSRQNRARALSPSPGNIIEYTPRIRYRAASVEQKPPLPGRRPPERPSTPSIYDRQPIFQDFMDDVDGRLSGQSVMDICRIKSSFRGMLSDKYKKMSYNDPAMGHEIGRKLLPWRDTIKRTEPASQRILQDHYRPRTRLSSSPTPRLSLYHRSTYSPSF